MLVKYVRDAKRKPVGVVVATGKYNVGWSLCSKEDKWNKKVGITMAVGRAILPKIDSPAQTVSKVVNEMKAKAVEFYK